jgi:hypothetical protein
MSRVRADLLLTAARLLLYAMGAIFLFAAVMLIIGLSAVITVERASIVEQIAAMGAPPSLYFWLLLAILLVAAIFAALVRFVHLLLKIIGTVDQGDPFEPANGNRLQTMGWLIVAVQLLLLGVMGISRITDDYAPETAIATDIALSGWLPALILFILARVFRHGAAMRADLEGTV